MVNINEKRKVGRPKKNKQPLTDQEKRKKREITNKKQRERYRNKIVLNPTKVRQYTKYENQIRRFKKSLAKEKSPLNERQTLLQTQQRNIEAKSEEKIQRKNEK